MANLSFHRRVIIGGTSAFGCNRSGNTDLSQEESTQAAMQPSAKPDAPQVDVKIETSRFWQDEEVGRIIESIGHDDAHVFRWEGGTIRAWVQFESEKWEFHSADVARNHLSHAEETPATLVSSGEVIVLIDKQAGDVYDCRDVTNVEIDGIGMVTVASQPGEFQSSSTPAIARSDEKATLSIRNGDTNSEIFEACFSKAK